MDTFGNDFPIDPALGMQDGRDENIEKDDAKNINKRFMKILKKIHKNQKRILAQNEVLLKQNVGLETSVKENSSVKKQDTFLHRLGDTVLKALPRILNTVVGVVCSAFFGRAFNAFKRNKRAIT